MNIRCSAEPQNTEENILLGFFEEKSLIRSSKSNSPTSSDSMAASDILDICEKEDSPSQLLTVRVRYSLNVYVGKC